MSGPLEHHPDCERTGDSCLICEACAWEVSRLFDWPTDAAREMKSWAESPTGNGYHIGPEDY